jgi:hypothetical protein
MPCRLHLRDDCTNTACVTETDTLTGSAVPNYDGSLESLAAASWCSPGEEAQIWAGTGTE